MKILRLLKLKVRSVSLKLLKKWIFLLFTRPFVCSRNHRALHPSPTSPYHGPTPLPMARRHNFTAPLRTLVMIIRRLGSALYSFCTFLPTKQLKAPKTTGMVKDDVSIVGKVRRKNTRDRIRDLTLCCPTYLIAGDPVHPPRGIHPSIAFHLGALCICIGLGADEEKRGG